MMNAKLLVGIYICVTVFGSRGHAQTNTTSLLDIVKLLGFNSQRWSQGLPNYRRGSAVSAGAISQACFGTCPPAWLNWISAFVGRMQPGSPMCLFQDILQITSCIYPNSPCRPGYSCCPISCLQTILGCYPGYPYNMPRSQCVPDDISIWLPLMENMYMRMMSSIGF